MGDFQFPGPRDRVTINGMTGSGKSTFALWLFAESADFDKKPWILIDYKGEDIIQSALKEEIFASLPIGDHIPKKSGIYVVMPDAKAGVGPVAEFLWRVYDSGNVGLFLDEATMIPELRGEGNSGGPFQSILSQGRSKRIPCWVLAQRPAHLNLMVLSENNYYCAFLLRSKKDLEKVTDNIPESSRDFERVWSPTLSLDRYWSRWYDVAQNRSFLMRPSPSADKILDILSHRVDKMKSREAI